MRRRLPEKTRNIERRPRKFRSNRYRSESFQQSPVREGQEIDVVIDDIGSRGDGITRTQGFLIFVPKTRIGERLRVKVRKVKGRFAIAEKLTM